MKTRYSSLIVLATCLALIVSLAGCKKSPSQEDLVVPPADVEGGVGTEVGSIGLGEERGMMTPYGESQFTPVYFGYDSSQVRPKDQATVEEVAEYLRNNPDQGVIVEGHCDERGSREYNMALGERRALAVRAYLIGLGIAPSRIQTKSMGEEDPVAFGHDEESWRLNRRSEFILFE